MIIVTGGAGFIGSHLVTRLNQEEVKDSIVVVDWLGEEGKWRNLQKAILSDFIPPEELFPYLKAHQKKVKKIIHLGAISSTTDHQGDKVIETNFRLSQSLWSWCSKTHVPFFYASSAATYGKGEQGFEDSWDPSYLNKLEPLNLYGWSKHLFDQWVSREVVEGRPCPPQWVGFKFFNVFGPRENHKGPQQSMISQIIRSLENHEPISLFKSAHPPWADGEQRRDFVWIGDCIDVIMWFHHSHHISGIFNVGSGQDRSFLEVAQVLSKTWGRRVDILYKDMPPSLIPHYQCFTRANLERLQQVGYPLPMTSLEKALDLYKRSRNGKNS